MLIYGRYLHPQPKIRYADFLGKFPSNSEFFEFPNSKPDSYKSDVTREYSARDHFEFESYE